MGSFLRLIRRTAAACIAALAAVIFSGAALPCAAAPPPTTARYPFDEGSGRTSADADGEGPATLRGDAMWGPGLVGEHALRLMGTPNGCAEVLHPAVDTSRSYTVMAWVRVNRVGGYQTFDYLLPAYSITVLDLPTAGR